MHVGTTICTVMMALSVHFAHLCNGAIDTMPMLNRPGADLRVQWLRHCCDGGRAVLCNRQRPALWRAVSDASNRLQKSVQGEDAYPLAPAMMLRLLLHATSPSTCEADTLAAAHRYTTSCFWGLVASAQTRRHCECFRMHRMLLRLLTPTFPTPCTSKHSER